MPKARTPNQKAAYELAKKKGLWLAWNEMSPEMRMAFILELIAPPQSRISGT